MVGSGSRPCYIRQLDCVFEYRSDEQINYADPIAIQLEGSHLGLVSRRCLGVIGKTPYARAPISLSVVLFPCP